jgi:hypothetical protein
LTLIAKAWTPQAKDKNALAESVKLQAHYAALLNQYDGGNFGD